MAAFARAPAAVLAVAIFAALAVAADPVDARPHKPPHRVHCKWPFRPRFVRPPGADKPRWMCVARIKPLPKSS
ncbi:MAG: hypothetical protein ACHP84_09300 [Caulobacterales bacterium]